MRCTTHGRPLARTSITTAACASCRRRRARTSRRPSTSLLISSPRAAGASIRASAPGTSRIPGRVAVGPCALLENAARYRDRWLANFLTIEGRAVRGWKGWPYAYVLPRQHQDSVGLATLLGILHRGQVEVRTALHPVAVGTQRFPAGSYVVALRQPYAGFAKTLLEPQRYPDLRLYPAGPPLPPYGVTAVAARDSLRIGLSAPVEPPAASPGYPGFAGPEAPRVGLYRSYAAPIDEGWTRWV